MPVIKAFHNSGRWDRSDELLARNVRRLRREGRSFGTRTELTRADQADELHWPDDGWGHFHPRNPEGPGFLDCAIEWDQDVWQREEAYVVQLTDIRIHTRRGFAQPFSRMPVVVLRHRERGRHLMVGVAHMALANTELRRAAWREEAHTIRDHYRAVHEKHPGWELAWQGDGNRNQRITALREAVHDHMLPGTGMHNCWVGHIPVQGGTHGPRSLLDLTLSTMPGASFLLPDDESSDHRPFATDFRPRWGK